MLHFQTPMQRLVRRMTRFFVKTDTEETMSHMITVMEKAGYSLKKSAPGQVCNIINTVFAVISAPALISVPPHIFSVYRADFPDHASF